MHCHGDHQGWISDGGGPFVFVREKILVWKASFLKRDKYKKSFCCTIAKFLYTLPVHMQLLTHV